MFPSSSADNRFHTPAQPRRSRRMPEDSFHLPREITVRWPGRQDSDGPGLVALLLCVKNASAGDSSGVLPIGGHHAVVVEGSSPAAAKAIPAEGCRAGAERALRESGFVLPQDPTFVPVENLDPACLRDGLLNDAPGGPATTRHLDEGVHPFGGRCGVAPPIRTTCGHRGSVAQLRFVHGSCRCR